MNFTIQRYDIIGSTNTEAAEQARRGAAEGLCVMADRQTAGRGRNGRTWVSESGSGLYFSVVLRPHIAIETIPLITLMAGVAVCDTLVEFGVKADIKWVNDLLVDERKICGILAETVDTDVGLAVVVGIGINLTSRNFPDEIADSATSIESVTGKCFTASEVAEPLTRYIRYFYDILVSPDGPGEIITNWRRRSSFYSGKPVRVHLPNEVLEGETAGLEENGALRVKTRQGSVKIIQAGDVELLRAVA